MATATPSTSGGSARSPRQIGFTQVSESHATSPLMKLVSRGDTTVVDAYLSPIIARYVDQVSAELGETRVQFMQSNGGLTDSRLFRGKDAILSGPAGGIVGMARTAQAAGFSRVIGFDMGGTSTDVSHFAGEFERQYETQVAGVRMRAPMLSIHTVAAGGGSVLAFDGSRYRVGPDSAGADPGPAAYRRGRPADRHRRQRHARPDPARALSARVRPGRRGSRSTPRSWPASSRRWPPRSGRPREPRQDPEEVAAGFLDIAVANMANAIKKISVQRGYDVTEYVLATFGGAGGQHACAVADALGMTSVLIHPLAGVLSALGLGLADVTAMREKAVEAPLGEAVLPELAATCDGLLEQARAELADAGVDPGPATAARRAHLKYEGTDTALAVPLGPAAGHDRRLRGRVPAALLVSHARPDRRRRGRLGRAHRGVGAGGQCAGRGPSGPAMAAARPRPGCMPADSGRTRRWSGAGSSAPGSGSAGPR